MVLKRDKIGKEENGEEQTKVSIRVAGEKAIQWHEQHNCNRLKPEGKCSAVILDLQLIRIDLHIFDCWLAIKRVSTVGLDVSRGTLRLFSGYIEQPFDMTHLTHLDFGTLLDISGHTQKHLQTTYYHSGIIRHSRYIWNWLDATQFSNTHGQLMKLIRTRL